MNTTTTNCPHCGAELLTEVPHGDIRYKCGYEYDQDHEVYYRTDLCLEREAHSKTKEERDKLQKNLDALAGFFYRAMQIVEGFRVTLEEITEGEVECKQLKELREDIEAHTKANKIK
jgi:ribosomal protein S27AE